MPKGPGMLQMMKFAAAHPKVISFLKTLASQPLEEGTIFELTVTKPGKDPISTNMTVKKSDIELIESLKKQGLK